MTMADLLECNLFVAVAFETQNLFTSHRQLKFILAEMLVSSKPRRRQT